MKLYILLFIGLFTGHFLFGANGNISGVVTENVEGKSEPVPFVNVYIQGTTIGALTDFDGKYQISVAPGKYNLVFKFIGYKTDTVENLEVNNGGVIALNHQLSKNEVVLKAAVVEAKADRTSENLLLVERKEATELIQTIGSKELSKKGASNAADGLKKVVGLSTIGNKYLQVRGLGDRYNAAYLNGLAVPSPDPDRKVIGMDLFPTDIVENISVTKGYRPDYYGDFTGGAIDINTLSYSEDAFIKVSLSTGLNTNTTFKTFKTYDGGSTDFLGLDDGTRNLEESIIFPENENQQLGAYPFKTSLTPNTISAPLASGFGFAMGNFKSFDKEANSKSKGLGYLFSVSQDNSSSVKNGKYKIANAQNDIRIDYDYTDYEKSTSSSVLGNLQFNLNENHNISYNLLFANISSDKVNETNGRHWDYANYIFARRMTYEQNSLTSNAISGEHKMAGSLILNWNVAYSNTATIEPDRRQLVLLYNPNNPENNKYGINTVDDRDNHRFFSRLNENQLEGKLNARYIIKSDEEDAYKSLISIVAGVDYLKKSRAFDYTRFDYIFNDDRVPSADQDRILSVNPNDPQALINEENYNAQNFIMLRDGDPASSNEAGLNIYAGYAYGDIQFSDKVTLIAGARAEMSEQSIAYTDQVQPIYELNKKITGLEILPSIALKIGTNKKSNLWFNASKTVTRPNFKEVAPFEFVEVFAGVKSKGNPTLQNGTNYNADVRYEIFPKAGELISFGVFYKYLQNPIEKTRVSTSSGELQTYINGERGQLAGAEIELTKKILFSAETIHNLSLGMNASLIYSKVNIGEDAVYNSGSISGGDVSVIVTNPEHQLQGASPYLVNADATYEKQINKVRTSITAAYNIFGKRLQSLGVRPDAGNDGIGDSFEYAAGSLNLIWQNKFDNGFSVSLSGKNLLDPTYKVVQENATENIEINSYKKGINVGLGVSFEF